MNKLEKLNKRLHNLRVKKYKLYDKLEALKRKIEDCHIAIDNESFNSLGFKQPKTKWYKDLNKKETK